MDGSGRACAEAKRYRLRHLPHFWDDLNAFGFDHIALQAALLAGGALLFAAMTFLSYKRACDDFERTDL